VLFSARLQAVTGDAAARPLGAQKLCEIARRAPDSSIHFGHQTARRSPHLNGRQIVA
jgi:hypothetical protein